MIIIVPKSYVISFQHIPSLLPQSTRHYHLFDWTVVPCKRRRRRERQQHGRLFAAIEPPHHNNSSIFVLHSDDDDDDNDAEIINGLLTNTNTILNGNSEQAVSKSITTTLSSLSASTSSSSYSSSSTGQRGRRTRQGEYYLDNDDDDDDQYSFFEDGVDPFDEDIDDDAENCYSNANNKDGYTCAINYNSIDRPYVSRMDSISTFVEYTDNDTVVVPAGSVGQFKETVACWLRQPLVEFASCGLVLINCYLIALSTLPSFATYERTLLELENIVSFFLLIEFIGSWWSSSAEQFRHIFSIQFLIDIVVIVVPLLYVIVPGLFIPEVLPGWLVSPSALTNLKLLRVLRIRRVLQDRATFSKFAVALGFQSSAQRVQDWQLQLARVLLSLFTLLSVASGLIYTTEHDINPQFSDYFTTLYFGLTTLTTVGFGDITPITWQGRLVVSGSIIVGIAIIPAQAAALIDALLERQASIRNNVITNIDATTTSSSLSLSSVTTKTKQTSRKKQPINGGKSNVPSLTSMPSQLTLETTMTCNNCNATMHWSNAKFCWSCGSNL